MVYKIIQCLDGAFFCYDWGSTIDKFGVKFVASKDQRMPNDYLKPESVNTDGVPIDTTKLNE